MRQDGNSATIIKPHFSSSPHPDKSPQFDFQPLRLVYHHLLRSKCLVFVIAIAAQYFDAAADRELFDSVGKKLDGSDGFRVSQYLEKSVAHNLANDRLRDVVAFGIKFAGRATLDGSGCSAVSYWSDDPDREVSAAEKIFKEISNQLQRDYGVGRMAEILVMKTLPWK